MQACTPKGLRGLSTGREHHSGGPRQRPSSAPLHPPPQQGPQPSYALTTASAALTTSIAAVPDLKVVRVPLRLLFASGHLPKGILRLEFWLARWRCLECSDGDS